MTHRALLYMTSVLGCFHLQIDYVLAKFTPPPPIISIDNYFYRDDWEPTWKNGEDIDIYKVHYLTADRNLNSLRLHEGSGIILNHFSPPYAPHKITIGLGGIQIYASRYFVAISGPGKLTSSQRFLDIRLNTIAGPADPFYINSVISDNGDNKVGLRIRGTKHSGWVATVLGGDKSNTFTGSVEVSGEYNVVSLNKEKGAIAIRGDIFINNHAKLTLWRDGQIARSSTVRLRDSTFQFSDERYEKVTKTESFKKLVIEGSSYLQFSNEISLDKRFLYLDDLSIDYGGKLIVQGWKEGVHFLLVRKTSGSLEDALKKIAFEGYLPGRTHLEDYNKEYWMISGTPEPTTYGAIFAAAGLGVI